MLAVAAFVAFWVVVALALVMVAARAGRSRPSRGLSRSASRSAIILFIATSAVFGLALPIIMLVGNAHNASANVGTLKLTVGERAGRQLFGSHCGVCHTLAAANTAGKVGPNLDILKPSRSIVLRTIANGCLPNAPASSGQACLGQGVMPAQVVQGRQAQQVAAYVAKVAGVE